MKKTNQNKDIVKWKANLENFQHWARKYEEFFELGLNAEPTIKVLIFLALLESKKPCTYAQIREIIDSKGAIEGDIPDITLRTSVLNLGKTLDKYENSFELLSQRGKFNLIKRNKIKLVTTPASEPVFILNSKKTIQAEDIAKELVLKSRLPFHSLYFLEWSARWWEIFSSGEAQIRVNYEVGAWEKLGIKNRILSSSEDIISMVALAPGEGLAEIAFIKKILSENPTKKIHYMAVDLSQRLLRQHISLLKETLALEIKKNRLICVGLGADIFNNFNESVDEVKEELVNRGVFSHKDNFMPTQSSLLITYLGNCLGNHYQDQETEIFSIINNVFQNRPLDFLVGVSVKRDTPDEYKRNWDDFLLQTPKHLLETNQLFHSSKKENDSKPHEFSLPENGDTDRCPPVKPEPYLVQHGISGQIYRFYYRLSYNLSLIDSDKNIQKQLPRGSLILLYSIIKYDLDSLVEGIKAYGLFNIQYDSMYHQIVSTTNGSREYAVFSAFITE
tara:strand:+ start:3498 stop:5006 length:1509 start_codon:yes stop_codon:yes gene_type:complete